MSSVRQHAASDRSCHPPFTSQRALHQVLRVREDEPVLHLDPAVAQIHRTRVQVAVDVLDGVEAGVRRAVGGDEAVVVEVVVVADAGLVFPPSAIGEERGTCVYSPCTRRERARGFPGPPNPRRTRPARSCRSRRCPSIPSGRRCSCPWRASTRRESAAFRALRRVCFTTSGRGVHEGVDVGVGAADGWSCLRNGRAATDRAASSTDKPPPRSGRRRFRCPSTRRRPTGDSCRAPPCAPRGRGRRSATPGSFVSRLRVSLP